MELMPLLAALFCGFLSGLGVGGGSLLMVYMTAVAALDQRAAQSINLLYFIPTALTALIFHAKNRFIDWSASRWAILGGTVAALLGSLLAAHISAALLQKLFGCFLLFVAVTEFRTKE